MESNKQSSALTENGIEIIRKIDNKSIVNITVQIQSIINDNPKYKKVIVCDNEESIQLLFPPKFTAQIGDIVTLTAIYPLKNKNLTEIVHIFVTNFNLVDSCNKIICSDSKKKEENIESKVTKADSIQKSEIKNETVNKEIVNSDDNSFNYKNCQFLSYLTTFTKEIHPFVKIERKYELRVFKNKRTNQDNKLFSVKMIDTEGFEMIATAFGEVADKLYDMFEEGGTYEIKGGYVRINEKKFSSVKADYKLLFDERTEIIARPDNGLFNKIQYNFSSIEELNNLPIGAVVDLLAIVIEVQEPSTLNTKNGPQQIRRLRLGDVSGYKIEITLWRQLSEIHIEPNTMILLRNVRVGEYNGKNLSTVDGTEIIFQENLPKIEEVEILQKFIASGEIEWKLLPSSGEMMDSSAPIKAKYLKEILDEVDLEDISYEKQFSSQKSKGDRRPLIKFKATICSITHSERNYYMGCPEQQCKKKLVQDNNGTFCEHCNKPVPQPKIYFTIQLRVRDASSEQFVDVFGEVAAKILGCTAEEYKNYIDTNDTVKLNAITEKIEFNDYYFIGSCRINEYNGIRKKRISCYRIEPIERKMNGRIQLHFLQFLLLNKI